MPAKVIDFGKIQNHASLRDQLRTIAGDPTFAWLKNIVDETTDDEVARILNDSIPQLDRYAYWTVDENIQVASRLLNNCIERRSDALALESEAISAALSLQLSLQSNKTDFDIAKVSLKAARAQAGLQPGDGNADEETLLAKNALVLGSIKARIEFHNTPGGSLNYGERVAFVRSLLSQNAVIARERLLAVWVGVAHAYGIFEDAPPVWSATSDNPLADWIAWLARITQVIDEGSKGERVQDVMLMLAGQQIYGTSAAMRAALAVDGPAALKFQIKREHIPDIAPDARVRVLAVGAALVYHPLFEEWHNGLNNPGMRNDGGYWVDFVRYARQSLSVDFKFSFPEQSLRFPARPRDFAQAHNWTLRPAWLVGASVWEAGSLDASVRHLALPQFINASPFGEWTVEIPKDVRASGQAIPRKEAGGGMPADSARNDQRRFVTNLVPAEVVFSLKLAIR